MWGALKAAASFQYAPLIALALVVTHGTALGLGYLKGSRHEANKWKAEQAEQLQEVVAQGRKLAPLNHRTVARVVGTKEGVKHEIQAMPNAELCGDGGLQFFNHPVEVIRAHTGSASGGADTAPSG